MISATCSIYGLESQIQQKNVYSLGQLHTEKEQKVHCIRTHNMLLFIVFCIKLCLGSLYSFQLRFYESLLYIYLYAKLKPTFKKNRGFNSLFQMKRIEQLLLPVLGGTMSVASQGIANRDHLLKTPTLSTDQRQRVRPKCSGNLLKGSY